jgi:hypothetical protein
MQRIGWLTGFGAMHLSGLEAIRRLADNEKGRCACGVSA